MAYLSFTTGIPIAIIKGGQLNNEIIYLFDPDLHKNPRRPEKPHRTIRISDGKIFPLPSVKPEQLYISGPNGSGKTYYVAQWLKYIREIFPEIEIYVISDLSDDPLLDKIPGGIKRITLTEDIVNDPLKPSDFQDAVVVFDDIDSIADKKISQAVNTLRDSLLKTSRHSNTYVVSTNHLTTDFRNTRVLINECRNITFFPKSGAANQITRILKEYCGLTPKNVTDIMSLDSRWVTVHKGYPIYVVYDHGVTLL